jgi:hypothetical protein
MKILTILLSLAVMVMGCYFADLGGAALKMLGFSFTLMGSLVLVDELASFAPMTRNPKRN